MSRTDRDAPYWTRAVWWAPLHRCAALASTEYPGHVRLVGHPRPASRCAPPAPRWPAPPAPSCDLPGAPDPWRRPRTRCEWWPLRESPQRQDGTSHALILLTWTGPQRARVRDECLLAIQEHRATGTVDTDPTTAHHHHETRSY